MQIQVHTDHNLVGGEKFIAFVKTTVEGSLAYLSARISSVEVHVSDENGAKSNDADKRCMMEARVEGHNPIAVTSHAKSVDEALDSALDKLSRSLDSTLGRIHHNRR